MKVLVIATHPLQDNRISKMIHTVSDAGYDVTYINISFQQDAGKGLFDGINVIKLHEDFRKNNLFGVTKSICIAKKYIKKIHPDIVHIHDPFLIPLLKTSKKYGAKTVYDKHEAYEVLTSAFPARVGAFFEKKYNRYIDGIVYVADMQRAYIDKFHYKSIKMIPNYQERTKFADVERKKHKEVRLIYVGDLSNYLRNTNMMLEIIDYVLAHKGNVTCIIGGKTEDSSVNLKIHELSSKYSGFIYKGYMLYENVIAETCNADIGLYFTPYDKNTFGSSPNKISEYLCAGIVVFAQGRFNDWKTIDNNAGMVFDYNASFEEMATALVKLVDDAEVIEDYKQKSAQIGLTKTWESVSSRYLEMYAELFA